MRLKGARIRIDARIPADHRMQLEELASYLGVSVSALAREAIRQLLERAYTDDGYIRDEVREATLKARSEQ